MPLVTDELDFERDLSEYASPDQQTLSPRLHQPAPLHQQKPMPFQSPAPPSSKPQQLHQKDPRQSQAERRTQLDSNDYIDDEEDPDLYNAIVASLLQPEAQKYGSLEARELDEEKRLLKEVMQLSKLEDAKNKGKVNLDFLKLKNKVAQEE